jgi:rubrerythrin
LHYAAAGRPIAERRTPAELAYCNSRQYQAAMTKTVRQLRAGATEYRELAETLGGESMKQALLEMARALERHADALENGDEEYSRLV